MKARLTNKGVFFWEEFVAGCATRSPALKWKAALPRLPPRLSRSEPPKKLVLFHSHTLPPWQKCRSGRLIPCCFPQGGR
jgi:hypothetical protein